MLTDASERELREAIKAYTDELGRSGVGAFVDVELIDKIGPLLESRDNAIAERDRRIAELRAKLEKVQAWLNRLAAHDEQQAASTRFETMREAYAADAKNYRATAADIGKVLEPTNA